MNPVKEKLKNGGVAYGHMVLEFYTPGIAPMLAGSGLEFVIFDMEHARCDMTLAAEMVAFCGSTELVPIIRVADANTFPLSRVLDLGARGVMIPRIESGSQMMEIVAQLKYAPEGKRGVALGVAHDRYQPGPPSFLADANADTMVIALLETTAAFERLDEIISVPGVDVAWMGYHDLTVSMGIPGQFEHPRFLGAMEALVAACARHNVAPGFLPGTPADTLRWIRKGFRMISLGFDIAVYMRAMRTFHSAVKEGLLAGEPVASAGSVATGTG